MPRFKIMGVTNDIDTCECCGRTDLKRTVILGILDADKNVMDVRYYGSNCAAKATQIRRTGKAIEALAEQAQRDQERAYTSRTVAVNENPVIPNALWVVDSVGSDGRTSRLCFATGTRQVIRDWAKQEYPNLITEVRKAI